MKTFPKLIFLIYIIQLSSELDDIFLKSIWPYKWECAMYMFSAVTAAIQTYRS